MIVTALDPSFVMTPKGPVLHEVSFIVAAQAPALPWAFIKPGVPGS